MALIGRTEIGLRRTGQTVNVPTDPRARLMYYIDCMCTVLTLDDDTTINRLRRYRNYNISGDELGLLIAMGLMLSPEVLLNKCIFQDDDLCQDSQNTFYELSAVRHRILVTSDMMIGGHNRQVHNIMAFKMIWLQENWTEPMRELLEMQTQEELHKARREQAELDAMRRRRSDSDSDSCCCMLL